MKQFDKVHADALFLKGKYKEAFALYYEGATEMRSSLAAFNLAYMFYQGFYTPIRYDEARRYFMAASALEGGAADFNLALMCMRGQGERVDFKAAVDHMRRAAAMGCVDAQLYLGTAYTLGQVFDPIEIECISMIPFYRVIKRAPEAMILAGEGEDLQIEDQRYEVISSDEHDALEMFELAAGQEDTTYLEKQIASAKTVLGQALIEGMGSEWDPARGWSMIEEVVRLHGSREAAEFLLANREIAQSYGVDVKRAIYLLGES